LEEVSTFPMMDKSAAGGGTLRRRFHFFSVPKGSHQALVHTKHTKRLDYSILDRKRGVFSIQSPRAWCLLLFMNFHSMHHRPLGAAMVRKQSPWF
jgi:hypothetical protein